MNADSAHPTATRRVACRRRHERIPVGSVRETHAEREQADPLESFLAEQAAARRRTFQQTLADELASIFELLETGLDFDDEQEREASRPGQQTGSKRPRPTYAAMRSPRQPARKRL